MQMTYVPADDMWMMYMPVDNVRTTYPPADDMQMMFRMMFQMTYVTCQPNLQRNLTLVSSACHLHVICTRLQFPDNFKSKSRQLC